MAGVKRPLLGMGLMVLASACFSLSGLFAQISFHLVSHWMTVFAAYAFGALLIFPVILARCGRATVLSPHAGLLFARGLLGVAQISALFLAMDSISLAEAMLLRETAPLWVPILSRILLGESMPGKLWVLVVCGFAGVGLVLHPNFGSLSTGYLFGLAAGLLFAIQNIMTRSLNHAQEPWERILFYVYAIALLSTAYPAAASFVTPDLATIGTLLLVALFFLASTACLIKAFGEAEAWLLAPLGYTAVVFSALLDWLVLDRVPELQSLFGMVLVIASGIAMILARQRRA